MAISSEPSTFEFCQDWLVSSEALVRDAMGIDALDLDTSRSEAKLRIYREEAYDAPEDEEEGTTAPDLPPPVNSRPRAIVITRGDMRVRVGTGTWGGDGQLLVCMEVPIPDEHLINDADDTTAQRAAKHASALEWASDLCRTIRDELMATSGQGAADGTPYLNAMNIDLFVTPGYPEEGEQPDYLAWIYEVSWK